jgi:ketosteroid isomerase-like protein
MPGAPPLVGKKAICGMLQAQKAQSNSSKTTGYTEDWNEVRVVGDYAWQWGRMSQTETDASGKQETMRVNAMRILQRQSDGSWRVARAVVTLAAQ